MPAAAPAAPPAAPATDVPRHVADLSDIQRCADSKKDDVMDRTSVIFDPAWVNQGAALKMRQSELHCGIR